MRYRVISVLVAGVLTACGSDIVETSGSGATGGGSASGGGGQGGAAGGAQTTPCSADFGEPVALQPALDRQPAVVQGSAERAPNIVVVPPADCQPLGEGLNAALLVADGQNVLLKVGADTIFCGCAIAEHALCAEMPVGSTIRVKGTMSYADNGMCNQLPCYELDVSAICTPTR